jgi:signal transduction histidine kinase
LKFSAADTRITLSLAATDEQLQCCVSDQGSGIPEQELPRLFDRFHRVPISSGAHQQRGAGLGLALVEAVARRHGGRVEVSSTPAVGSRFCLLLPFETMTKKKADSWSA